MVPQQRPRPVDQGAMQSHMPARSAQVDQGAKSSHMPARNAQGVPLGRSRWGHSSYSWCSPRLAAPAAPVPSALEATCHLARGDRSSSVARSWRPMRCEKPWAKDEAQRLAPSCAAARDLRSAERAGSFSRSRGEFSPATRTYDGYPPRLFVFSFWIYLKKIFNSQSRLILAKYSELLANTARRLLLRIGCSSCSCRRTRAASKPSGTQSPTWRSLTCLPSCSSQSRGASVSSIVSHSDPLAARLRRSWCTPRSSNSG